MNCLILGGLRTIKTEETFEANTDYGIFLIAALEGRYLPETNDDTEPNEIKYHLKVSHVDSIMNLKSKTPIKFESKQTKSQTWRWIVEKSDDYDLLMQKMISHSEEVIEFIRDLK